MAKTEQLQIRVTAAEKAQIKARARQANEDVSSWVLKQLLPTAEVRFQAFCETLVISLTPRPRGLAEVGDFLAGINAETLLQAVARPPRVDLEPFEANYLAAMIEQNCVTKETDLPNWLADIEPLPNPWFASSLASSRLRLLMHSPPAFRSRNLFIDAIPWESPPRLPEDRVLVLLERLNAELANKGVKGELFLLGGAVICLVFEAGESSGELIFQPARVIRAAAKRVAVMLGYPENWLNDAVMAYLGNKGEFHSYLCRSNLRVSRASPEYLLAMKCLALRVGEEFHDQQDVGFLLRYLNLESYASAIDIITRYYPPERLPQKTLDALGEMLQNPR